MKKSLLAIAVAAALPALAQAQVTLYGKMDLGVGSIDRGGAAKSMMTVDTGIGQTSRLGIRGVEKMDGGLSAIFQIEGAVTADSGNTITFNRESWVGIGGGFGEIRLGRTLTPSFHADALGDIMGYSFFGGQANWSSGGSGVCVIQTGGTPSSIGTVGCGSTTVGAYSTRFSNGINWTSPSMSGLVVRAAYAFSERDGTTATTLTTTPNSVDQAFDIAALYTAGPLGAALGYQDQKILVGTPATLSQSRKVTTLAGSYTMGNITVKGGWATSELGAAATRLDLSKTNLGVSVKVGVGTVMASYSMYESDTGATPTNRKANVLGLAYNHPLSKNTMLYATYGSTDNKNANSQYGLWAGGVSYSAYDKGVDASGFGFGIIHNF